MKIVDASENSVADYSYNAWGEVLTATGTLASVNPLRYRGYYYDSESGFYYVKSRYYDPRICRFINADIFASTGQGFTGCNMFAYCNDNPVDMVDDTGKIPKSIDVSIEMFVTALNGDGSEQVYSEGSKLVNALKKSKIMRDLVDTYSAEFLASKESEMVFNGSVSLYGKANKFDFDLSYSVGKANYTMTFSQERRTVGFWFFKKEQARVVVNICISDTYDFDEIRKDGSFGSMLNNIGYSLQNAKLLKPYLWTANYTVYGEWK